MDLFHQEIEGLKRTLEKLQQQTQQLTKQTNRQEIPTHQYHSETFSTGNKGVSTGNQGVPTDRQTNQQTDRQIEEVRFNPQGDNENIKEIHFNTENHLKQNDKLSKIDEVSRLLNSLDTLKKDLRLKFKKLTTQEMLVFSTIYQLQAQAFEVDYTLLSNKTNLSESSIRDYVQKLKKKEIPVDKIKHNNKKIILTISQDFKKIASLSTIISLREL